MDRDKAIRFMHDLLRTMVERGGSDLFITVGMPPAAKINGLVGPLTDQALTPAHTQVLVRSMMNDKQSAEFERTHECQFAVGLEGVSRFRVSAFTQRGHVGMVLRTIQSKIPSFQEIHMPPQLKEIAMTRRGLVIFVGATSSGKSTSLAAM
ncbi:MAG: type IV pili twitching motility protein PilT, partial [Thioalkalivibrio sp.]|nr:type IV pili twitching motility protein PilT [Thioalkalivibrio sp.]